MSEHDNQVRLFSWAAAMAELLPDLAGLYAVPNGGYRAKATAVKLKAEGVKRGVPDVHLPVARGGYLGCWIEMKWGSNKPTADQVRWLGWLAEHGHFVTVCYTWEAAADTLERYLRGRIVKGEA